MVHIHFHIALTFSSVVICWLYSTDSNNIKINQASWVPTFPKAAWTVRWSGYPCNCKGSYQLMFSWAQLWTQFSDLTDFLLIPSWVLIPIYSTTTFASGNFIPTFFYSMLHHCHLPVISSLVSSPDKPCASIITLWQSCSSISAPLPCTCAMVYNFTPSSISFILRMKYPVDSVIYVINCITNIVLDYTI